jgi:hypothetical protein
VDLRGPCAVTFLTDSLLTEYRNPRKPLRDNARKTFVFPGSNHIFAFAGDSRVSESLITRAGELLSEWSSNWHGCSAESRFLELQNVRRLIGTDRAKTDTIIVHATAEVGMSNLKVGTIRIEQGSSLCVHETIELGPIKRSTVFLFEGSGNDAPKNKGESSGYKDLLWANGGESGKIGISASATVIGCLFTRFVKLASKPGTGGCTQGVTISRIHGSREIAVKYDDHFYVGGSRVCRDALTDSQELRTEAWGYTSLRTKKPKGRRGAERDRRKSIVQSRIDV